MVEPLRHRQTKEAATDMSGLQPPRHISTLPFASFCWCPRHVRLSSGTYREGEPAIGALAQHRHARAHAISDPGTAFIGTKNHAPSHPTLPRKRGRVGWGCTTPLLWGGAAA